MAVHIRARHQDLHRLDQAEEREQVHKLWSALTKMAIRGPRIGPGTGLSLEWGLHCH